MSVYSAAVTESRPDQLPQGDPRCWMWLGFLTDTSHPRRLFDRHRCGCGDCKWGRQFHPRESGLVLPFADTTTGDSCLKCLLGPHSQPLGSDVVECLEQRGQLQLLCRHQGLTFCGEKRTEGGFEAIEGLIRLLSDPPQRMAARFAHF